MAKPVVPFALRLPPELAERLKAAAQKQTESVGEFVSQNDVIIAALTKHLEGK